MRAEDDFRKKTTINQTTRTPKKEEKKKNSTLTHFLSFFLLSLLPTTGRVAVASLPSARPFSRRGAVSASASIDASAGPLFGNNNNSRSGRGKWWSFDDDDGVFLQREERDEEDFLAACSSSSSPSYGCELTDDQWDPLGFHSSSTAAAAAAGTFLQAQQSPRRASSSRAPAPGTGGELGGDFGTPGSGGLPAKLAALVALVVFSRVGVYERLPGVDVDAFGASLRSGGLLGYIDTLSGGSISRVGLFSLGIVPYINASIVLQLLATAFPSLKKLQREEGPQGQARFQLYQKLLALVFAVAQAAGQLSYVRPFVDDWSPQWALASGASLVAGAMVLVHVADTISELKIGNGTSVLITANIASSLPTSIGAALTQAADKGAAAKAGLAAASSAATSSSSADAAATAAEALASADKLSLALYGLSFLATTLGVVYVQEAERKIPINYASRYRAPVGRAGGGGGAGGLSRASYLPFKVNATGVMPVIFASTLLSLPSGLARYAPALEPVAAALGPTGALYLPVSLFL